MEIFSTIASPALPELVIIHTGATIHLLPRVVELYKTLRKMNEVRPFKLVFLLEAEDIWVARRNLEGILDSAAAKGLLDFLDSPPTIRTARPRHYKWDFLDFS